MKRCGPRKRGPNPTCAGPYPYGSRCQNPGRNGYLLGESKPGQSSDGLWRRGQAAIPRGVACFGLTVVRGSPSRPKHEAFPCKPPSGENTVIVGGRIGCLMLSPEENGTLIIPTKSHGVSARGRVTSAYKSVTKWRTYAPERRRRLSSLLFRDGSRSGVRPRGQKGETAESGESHLVT
jgi:hypothetical protein